MRTILIQKDVKDFEGFKKILETNLENFKVITTLNDDDLSNIEVVIFWHQFPQFLSSLPALKLVLICGSGIDHILKSYFIPPAITFVRLVDNYLRERVSEYVIEEIITYYSQKSNYINDKEDLIDYLQNNIHVKPKIGIMGMGLIGSLTAEKLLKIGFEVCCWVNSHKLRSLSEVYIGPSQLEAFARQCNIIVCHLPLTKETKNILNSDLFSKLKSEAFLINVGRGDHLNESDLIEAISVGNLAGACLDVLSVEPLNSDHQLYNHNKIKITPHIAGYVSHETQAPYAAEIICNFYRNQIIDGTVNIKNNY